MTVEYTLLPGLRLAQPTGKTYAVEEIYVDGVLVGSMHAGGNYRFGEVTGPDGRTYPHGDCVLDSSDSRDTMVGMIMRHREVGDVPDWRGLAAGIERLDARQIG